MSHVKLIVIAAGILMIALGFIQMHLFRQGKTIKWLFGLLSMPRLIIWTSIGSWIGGGIVLILLGLLVFPK